MSIYDTPAGKRLRAAEAAYEALMKDVAIETDGNGRQWLTRARTAHDGGNHDNSCIVASFAALLDASRAVREARDGLFESLDDLFDAIRAGEFELDCGMPTFGGVVPADTTEVWSWDADRLMVGTSANDLDIVDRAEWRAVD